MAAWLVMLVWVSQMWAQAFLALKAPNLTQPPSRAGALASTHVLLPMWLEHVTALGVLPIKSSMLSTVVFVML